MYKVSYPQISYVKDNNTEEYCVFSEVQDEIRDNIVSELISL